MIGKSFLRLNAIIYYNNLYTTFRTYIRYIPRMVFLSLLTIHACPSHAMEIDHLPCQFNALPIDIVGNIIAQLTKSIGTPSLKNKEDIPVIIKKVKALSLANKDLYTKVNSLTASRIFIESLVNRFDMTPVDAAGEINTQGTRERLKQYVKGTGEYELFKVMQEIFKIAREVREEFKPLDFSIGDGQKGWPGSNPFYSQTKQGFFITTDSTPNKLYTPWGYVMLFGGGYGKGWAFDAFSQAFLKRFKTSFAYVTKSSLDRDRVKFYALKQQEGSQEVIDLKALLVSGNNESYENIYKELSEEEIEAQQGKDVLIHSNYCGCEAIYKLHEVNGHQLPEAEMLPYKDYRSYKVTKIIWDILQDQYNQEHGIIKKTKHTEEKVQKMELCNDKPKPTSCITSIKTASEECIALLEKLNDQPLFTGTGSIAKKCKVLPLEDWNDCRIVNILCSYAEKKLGHQQAWHVHDFGCGNNRMHDENGNDLKNGITEWLYKDYMPTRCSLEELKLVFDELINQSITGWKQSTLIEHPDIFHTQSEEEWYLFIKPKIFNQEDNLLCLFSMINNLRDEISCHHTWYSPKGSYEYRDTLYLWIKKKTYDKVIKALNLQINGSCQSRL